MSSFETNVFIANKQTKELKTPPTWTKQQLIDLILAKSITFLLMNFNMGIGD